MNALSGRLFQRSYSGLNTIKEFHRRSVAVTVTKKSGLPRECAQASKLRRLLFRKHRMPQRHPNDGFDKRSGSKVVCIGGQEPRS